MNAILALSCLAIALAPVAQAGSFLDPEISDIKGDGGTDTLDILSVWIDPTDANNLAIHVALAGAPPVLPVVQGMTVGTDPCAQQTCVHSSLTYVFTFRVLAPTGAFTPAFEDYAFTQVAFRHGPTDPDLVAAIAYGNQNGFLTYDGSRAQARVNGTELTLLLPRASAFVNVPRGATPGAYRVDRLSVHTLPEFCFPRQDTAVGSMTCAPLAKPVPPTASTPPSTTAHWDNAPDAGFGRVFTFPSPAPPTTTTTTQAPPPGTVTLTRTQTVTKTFTQSQPGSTVTYTETLTQDPVTTTVAASSAAPATGAPPATAKKSAAPELMLVLLGVAGILAVRRRLSE